MSDNVPRAKDIAHLTSILEKAHKHGATWEEVARAAMQALGIDETACLVCLKCRSDGLHPVFERDACPACKNGKAPT